MYVPIRDVVGRLSKYFNPIPGLKVSVLAHGQSEAQILWLLGQEGDYLIFSPTSRVQQDGVRRYSAMSGYMIDEMEPLGKTSNSTKTTPEFLQGRISVHMLDLSGSRSWVEINHLNPIFGGLFVSPNHLLGFTLLDVHTRLMEMGLLTAKAPELVQGWDQTPVKMVTQHLPSDLEPVASLHAFTVDNGGASVLTAVFTELAPDAPKDMTHDWVNVWAYEQLYREAAQRWLVSDHYGLLTLLQHHRTVH